MQDNLPRNISADGTFVMPVRVYYEDTDAGGIVYYANYLKFAERARSEYIRTLGFDQQAELSSEDRIGFAVRHCEIDYLKPAVLDDLLTVSCKIVEYGGASALMRQEIRRGEETLVVLDVKVACLNLIKKRPVRMPASLVQKIEKYI